MSKLSRNTAGSTPSDGVVPSLIWIFRLRRSIVIYDLFTRPGESRLFSNVQTEGEPLTATDTIDQLAPAQVPFLTGRRVPISPTIASPQAPPAMAKHSTAAPFASVPL